MPDHQEENSFKHLTVDEQKRLDELSHNWAKEDISFFSGSSKLSVFDLKLLLLHFVPLKSLIQQLAHQKHSNTSDNTDAGSSFTANSTLAADASLTAAHSLPTALVELQALEQQLSQAHGANSQLVQQLQQLQSELNEQQNKNLTLENALTSATAKLKQLEAQYQQAQQALTAASKALSHPVQNILRQDLSLSTDLGLNASGGEEPSSTDLISTVAVMSQLDSVKRLWDLLKDRCEQQNRAASQAEAQLLATALGWHNHNWQQKPYQLFEPTMGQSFDFNQQQRAAFSQPIGETIKAVVLPGIRDYAGRLLKKALVITTP
ncbi:hypothetical protein [Shewanella xiamenensis]|uniref:hypothetical protein n=1 Tax=Shewanella xiamenensis TaxID=332186 RepID=UPI001C4E7297|nr:hypothetical protein [Shewanella xiamenensis]MBW0281478.1 hypothetical protein [Shewanella xiamenensis]MCT8872149.1 hypothetical protein [Shewanella xiamenensis]UWH40056.1 hypothetical protein KXJ80_12010 [Shewanella xiamenensis]